MSGAVVLDVQDVDKIYGGGGGTVTAALQGISFTVVDGDFVGIMGASGSGKTTLLNCISTIDTVSSGHIVVGGEDITRMSADQLADHRASKLGFVFQDYNLLETLTAYENIALTLTITRTPPAEIPERVRRVATVLGIEDLLDSFPHAMSGGQRQRVACARAIINDPALLLADEPTGALDSHSARRLLEALEGLNTEHGSTVLMVTHDPFTASYCRRILFVEDGRIFTEIHKGRRSRTEFFEEIIRVVATMGSARR